MDIPPAEKKQEAYEADMEGEQMDEQTIAAETAEETPAHTAPPHAHSSHPHAAPVGPPKPGRMDKLKQFYRECVRVYRVTKKPNKPEFMTIVKVSAVGILIIGAIGFIVHLIQRLFIG